MRKMKVHKLLLLFSSFFLVGGTISSCAQPVGENNYSSVRITFPNTDVEILVGEGLELSPSISGDASLDDFDVIQTNDNVTVTKQNSSLYLEAKSAGQCVVTLVYQDDTSVQESILISVLGEDTANEYSLEVDLIDTPTEYLLNEELDFENLRVYAYLYINGVKDEESAISVSNYSVDVEGGTSLNTLGRRKVTISSDVFGSTSFDIEVKTSVQEKYLTVDLSNTSVHFPQNSTFSSSGLQVIEHTNVRSLDTFNNIVRSSSEETINDYSLSFNVSQILSECGIYEVEVTKVGTKGTSYTIYVEKDDNTLKDLASSFINTKNVALEMNSTIPNEESYFGSHFVLNFKPSYLVKSSYKKSNRNDDSTTELTSKAGLMKDKNNNIISFSENNGNISANSLIKKNGSSYWDYLNYGGYASFKEFSSLDFPTKSYSNDSGYYLEKVTPVEGSDNYQTSLNSYPLVKGTLEISGVDLGLFRYVNQFEISHDDKTLEIKVNIKGYGSVSLKALEKNTNLDDENVLNSQKNDEFTFDSNVNPSILDVKEAINGDNYSIANSYGRTYYTKDYFYQYYEPIAIIMGLSSQGFVAIKDSNYRDGSGVYYFRGIDGGDNVISGINEDTITQYYADTSTIKYSDLFVQLTGMYLSTSFKDLLDDDELLATFDGISGTNLYLSKNADVGEIFLSHFGGSDTSSLIESGYIYGGILVNYEGSDLSEISLYLVNEELYGYAQTIEDFGKVKINAIEEYFNL